MLNASVSTPASTFFARVNGVQRSTSLRDQSNDVQGDTNDLQETAGGSSVSADGHGNGSSGNAVRQRVGDGDVRRAVSLRVPGSFGGSRTARDAASGMGGMSFGAAGSNLSSPLGSGRSTSTSFAPPAASRHPLFSHHASPPVKPLDNSDALSDAGLSGISTPPSPSGSVSSSAFSPASAFLSHFSSSGSLRSHDTEITTSAPDAQGARVLDYTLGKLIGRGGFSSVRKAHHVVTGEVFACKIVKREDLSDTSGSLENFEEEIKTWQAFPRHPSILPLLEMHRTPTITFLITPYLPGGSLLDVLKREEGSDKTARKWFPGVVQSVSALHEGYPGFPGRLLHGDLKLDNFLVDHAGNVTVGDFFTAKSLLTPNPDTTPTIPMAPLPISSVPPPQPVSQHFIKQQSNHAGPRHSLPFTHLPGAGGAKVDGLPLPKLPSASLPYAPPELLRAPPSEPSLAQDIWAMGIILHALLTGRLPFFDAFDPRLQMKILRGTYPEPTHLGKEWLECLRGCLELNKDARWTIARVKTCDAVIGWQEVRGKRSKSRSRSRQGRSSSEYRRPFGDRERQRDGGAQPVPIHRRRAQSRASPADGRAQSNGRAASREPPHTAPGTREATRSRSASGSRSRSSGRGGAAAGGLFDAHADHSRQGLDRDISHLSLTQPPRGRGRSAMRTAPLEEEYPDLQTATPLNPSPQSSQAALYPIPAQMHGYQPGTNRARSSSRKRLEGSRSRGDLYGAYNHHGHQQQHPNQGDRTDRSLSRGYEAGSSSRGDSTRASLSPSTTTSNRGSRSGSRSRSRYGRAGGGGAGGGGDEEMTGYNAYDGHGVNPQQAGYGGQVYGYEGYDTGSALDVVTEEWKGEEERGRPRGRPER